MPHEHTVHHSTEAANKEYFDKKATTYDDQPQGVELAHRSAQAMLKAYSFDENTTTVMDYACGTGLISRELAPYVKSIIGVDISKGMVDQYNERVHNQGISADEMHAVCQQLKGEEGELDGAKFHVIVCASAFHHFPSINDVTKTLAYFLQPGGSLLVVDLLKTNDVDISMMYTHEHEHVVPHKGGFEEADIRIAFEGANLESFTFGIATTGKQHGHPATVFIATGKKPLGG